MPQLGFILEDSGISLCLDIADLYRDSITLPVAFAAVRDLRAKNSNLNSDLEPAVRRLAGRIFRKEKLVSQMIERIKELFADDRDSDA
jgi:CRISPR-associated protein Cas1